MKQSILIVILMACTVASTLASNNGEATEASNFLSRDLGVTAPPSKYDEKLSITYSADLGCGSCIRGGYVYCIPGAEGSDPATWTVYKSDICCRDASCIQAKDILNYNCSNTYSDSLMAKALCPFSK